MNNKQKAYKGCGWGMILALFMATAALILSSCTTTKYVQVPEYHTDTLIVTKHQRDSVWLHDSIYTSEKQKGDTIFVEVRKWSTKYREKILRDTTYISKVDTIAKPYPVEVKVPRELTWWQKLRLYLGNFMVGVIISLVIFGGIKLYQKLHP